MKINFRKKVAIDLGTNTVLIYTRNGGVILKEPCVVAIDRYNKNIVAVGEEAKQMIGRTSENLEALRPLEDGIIVDYRATETMITEFLRKSIGRSLIRPDIVMVVPSNATQVQRRAVIQAGVKSGGNNIYLIEEALAAALGAGVDISDSSGNMIIDIGGGTTDIAVISSGKYVVSESIKVGGDTFDKAIIDYLRKNFNIIIGEKTAEEIKLVLASVDTRPEMKHRARGRKLYDGLPVEVELRVAEIEQAISQEVSEIVEASYRVLSNTPPELSADLYEKGIILTGGGALTRGLVYKLQKRLGAKVSIAENPATAVVRGAGKALNLLDILSENQERLNTLTRRKIENKERFRRR